MADEELATLTTRIASLNEEQLKYVLRRVNLHLEADAEPVVSEEDLLERQDSDRIFIEEVTTTLQVTEAKKLTEQEATAQFLILVVEQFPEYRKAVTEALDELNAENITLDFGLSAIALNALVLAVAAAIIRPRVTYSEKSGEGTGEKHFEFDIRGVKDISAMLKPLLSFIGKGES